jgi:hypothetical protein
VERLIFLLALAYRLCALRLAAFRLPSIKFLPWRFGPPGLWPFGLGIQADRASNRYRNGLELCSSISRRSIRLSLLRLQLIRKVLKLPGSIWKHNKFF